MRTLGNKESCAHTHAHTHARTHTRSLAVVSLHRDKLVLDAVARVQYGHLEGPRTTAALGNVLRARRNTRIKWRPIPSKFARVLHLTCPHGCSEPAHLHCDQLRACPTAPRTPSNQKLESAAEGTNSMWTRAHTLNTQQGVGQHATLPNSRAVVGGSVRRDKLAGTGARDARDGTRWTHFSSVQATSPRIRGTIASSGRLPVASVRWVQQLKVSSKLARVECPNNRMAIDSITTRVVISSGQYGTAMNIVNP